MNNNKQTAHEVAVNSREAWLLATRPKTLTGAMIPVILAGALALHNGVMHWGIWVCCLLFAGGMQITANLINDLYDYLRGTDREDRLGPERACAQGWITPQAMRRGIWVSIALACLCGLGALAQCWESLPWHGAELVALGALCVLFAFLYTQVFSYLGMGDVLVLVFFGLVPVCGTYWVMSLELPMEIWLLSLVSGIAIDALLIINNYRDREQDRISGKRTIIVLGGERFGELLYLAVGLVALVLSGWVLIRLGQGGRMPLLCLYLGLHVRTWIKIKEIKKGKALNALLGETSRNMLILAITMALAML